MVFCNIDIDLIKSMSKYSHNPYFNRWFSAIVQDFCNIDVNGVTILILIDGFLQWKNKNFTGLTKSSQSLF